jgi:predicted Zn finger-like uncharacterized protein
MISVSCSSCGARYRVDETKMSGGRARLKCPKCQASFEVTVPQEPAEAPERPTSVSRPQAAARPPEDTTSRAQRIRSDEDIGGQTITTSGLQAAGAIELPTDKKYSLAVLDGKSSGEIFPITKVRTVIGRANCDITLDDPECSRQHAVVEVMGSRVTVSDLKSTNGLFVDGKRVERANLDNQSEFRVGDHVLMLIITDRE